MHSLNQLDWFLNGESVNQEIGQIIIQYFYENGLEDVGNYLEERLDCHPFTDEFVSFKDAYFKNDWREAENVCTVLLEKNTYSNLSLTHLYHTEFYHCLSQANYKECLILLRKIVNVFKISNEHLFKTMAFDLILKTTNENYDKLVTENFVKICGMVII